LEGEDIEQSSGEMSREDAKPCLKAKCELENALLQSLRHCERSEAIQSLSADAFLDCFAALAMTVLRQCMFKRCSRAPDAAQRHFDDALQSRGPCGSELRASWVPALRSSARACRRRT
jgi:hypothetical protein